MITRPDWSTSRLSPEDQERLETVLHKMDGDALHRAWLTSINDFFSHQTSSIYGFIKTVLLEKDGLGEDSIKHAFTVLLMKSCENMGHKIKAVNLEYNDYGPLAGVICVFGHQGQSTTIKFDLDFVRQARRLGAGSAPQTLAN